jgi:hypothetical protein
MITFSQDEGRAPANPSEESRVRVDLTAVIVAVNSGVPYVLSVDTAEAPGIGLPSGPLVSGHRTLQAGLRAWVETQTRCKLEYVEQLYTFGDRVPAALAPSETIDHRAVSIAYLALVSMPAVRLEQQAHWISWYSLFPWEDRREGEGEISVQLREYVYRWGDRSMPGRQASWREQVDLIFGAGRVPWDEERALERYEMLYAAQLVEEAYRDRDLEPPEHLKGLQGRSLVADHRRIAATAVSRLRAKIKYRPVLFELMPAQFTLSDLQRTAEALSGITLHKQNFRRLVEQQDLVEETGEVSTTTGGRPAKLMRFRKDVLLERPTPGLRVSATRRGSLL